MNEITFELRGVKAIIQYGLTKNNDLMMQGTVVKTRKAGLPDVWNANIPLFKAPRNDFGWAMENYYDGLLVVVLDQLRLLADELFPFSNIAMAYKIRSNWIKRYFEDYKLWREPYWEGLQPDRKAGLELGTNYPIGYLTRDNNLLCQPCAMDNLEWEQFYVENEDGQPTAWHDLPIAWALCDQEYDKDDPDSFPEFCDQCNKPIDLALRGE